MRSAITSNATPAMGTARRARRLRTAGRCLCLGAHLVVVAVVGVAGVGVAAGVLVRAAPAFAEGCVNEAFRTGPSVNLPDCRAYELVTPERKSAAVQDLDAPGMGALAAVNGDRFALRAVVSFGSTPVANGSLSVFSRTPSGWQITSVPPLGAGADFYESPIFSPELTQVGFTVETLEEPPLGQAAQFGAPGSPQGYTTLATTPNTTNSETYLAGGALDFNRMFLDSTDHALVSGAPTGTVAGAHDVYEWAGGGLRLVNVTSGGSLVGECGARVQGVSEDGSRVIFQSPDPQASESSEPSCKEPWRLYTRVTETVGGREESQTVEVSKPNEGVVEHTGAHPVYSGAVSADGSKVFFSTATELTKDDEGVDEREPGELQLYEYDANAKAGERLTRISNSTTGPVPGGTTSDGNNETVFISTDGSKVYFLTRRNQIYRYDTLANELRLVAATAGNEGGGAAERRWNEVTPNGNFFVFVTSKVFGFPVTNPEGYDEVYRYDDESGNLTCVSCLRGGAVQTGGAAIQPPSGAGIIETEGLPTPKFIVISEDGSYVFFESTQSLVSQAVNVHGGGTVGGNFNSDVYEWHDGVVSLISSPIDQREQVLLGASADGSNVFFLTHASLVSQDVDSSADIYDARIDGGFPPSTESAACLGDTCQSVPAAPFEPALGTAVSSGTGNVVPVAAVMPKMVVKSKAKGCSRGRVRKKGRCVKRRKAKKAGRLAGGSVKHDRGGVK
jgi:hypothetical protein